MSSCAVMSSQTESFSKESNVISNKLTNDLDAKVSSSSKQVLLQRIEFKAASKPDEQYEKLKQKYKPLNQNTPQVNGHHQDANSSKKDDLPEPKQVLCNPDKISLQWSKLRRVGPGLSNLGNTCYLNSVIQVLTYTPPLVNFLATQEHTRECRAVGFCMMCELQRHIIRSFNHHQNESIKPLAIIQKLRCIAKHLRFGHQEDAHEFLRYVIDGMLKSCLHGYEKLDKASKETTVIHRIFSGYYRSQVRCLICHNTSSTFDPLMDVMLDIKQSPTVVRALQRLCKPELLDGDNLYCCLKCKKKVPAHKQVLIHKPPNILTVQLKRFDSNHIFGGKVTKSIEYSEHLDLRPFMTAKGGPVKYKLYGVLVHSGYSSNSGHYYCYVRGSNNSWYNMNDSVVRQVSLNAALSQQAYLLFYTRMAENGVQQEKKPFTPLSPKPAAAQTPQQGPKLIKDSDIGTPLSRNQAPKFPQTFTTPTTTPKPSPSTISSEPRQKLSFTIKTPTKIAKTQFNEQNTAQENQPKLESPQKHKHITHDNKSTTENQAKTEPEQKHNSKTATEAEDSKKKSCEVLEDLSSEVSSKSEIASTKELKAPEPVHVSFPVKKESKQESPTKNVRPPHLFIPRSVQSKTPTTETKSNEDKASMRPAKATTPWKVTPQHNNNFIYGPMSPPPKGTPLPQPSPSSVISDTSSSSSKTAKTGEWDIKDKNIPTPGPILPERQHAGWRVSEKSGNQKAENIDDDGEDSWVEGSSKKAKKKRKKEKQRESKKYQKLNNEEEENVHEDEENEEKNKQAPDQENKKKHKKKKKKKEKTRRESDRENLLKDKSSDEETAKVKAKKRKKAECVQEIESKRQRLVDYTSDDSESLEDQNNNTMENTPKDGEKKHSKHGKKEVPVVVYTGNHGDKQPSKPTWDGSRESLTVDALLKGSGGIFGYGDNVTTWEGGESLVNAGNNDRKREKPRDSWDEELDKGKVKKVKDKSKLEKSSGMNFFQREQDKRNKKGVTERITSHFTRRHSSSHSRSHSSRAYRRM